MRRAPVLAMFLASAALRAADKMPTPAPSPAGPVPIPYPNTGTTARDVQAGQATGQRMHKPYVFSKELDVKMSLADGRTFVVNRETGQVVFGDGVQGARPETGRAPADGTYRLGGGSAGNVQVKGGRVLAVPTPAAPKAR